METREIASLSSQPIAAAQAFYRECLPDILDHLASSRGHLCLFLPAENSDHDDWRRAAARDLAREYAPSRVNLIGGGDASARAEALAYLRDAPGITGQYLPLS